MTTNVCRFTSVTDMAEFCAGLTERGIAFHTYSVGTEYIVEITGY